MRRALAVPAAFASAWFVAAPAAAQRDTEVGSRLKPRSTFGLVQNAQDSARAGHRFAGCLYVKQSEQVKLALAQTEPAQAVRRLSALQSRGTCINLLTASELADSQSISLPVDIYRGMLAEAVIRNMRAKPALASRKVEQTYARPWFAVTGRATDVDEMGVCVADVDPQGIASVLATDPESKGESAALRKLSPALGACLGAGTKLTSNRQSLRATLAEALYHRLVTPQVSVPVPEKK